MRLIRTCLVLLLSFFAVCACADPAISISALRGQVTIVSNGQKVVPRASAEVHQGDRITVGKDAWLTLRFSDGGSFTLRSGSDFVVDRYQYSATDNAEDGLLVSLFKGSMRAISGLVAKKNQQNYAIRTPTATVGVRGTDHDVIVVTEEEATEDTEAGTYNRVNDGETVLQTEAGEVHLLKGQAGRADPFGRLPRLLDRMPRLLKRIKDDDLRNGILEHLKSIHEMMQDGTFRAAAKGLRELRQLRGPENRGKRREVLKRMLDDMDKAGENTGGDE